MILVRRSLTITAFERSPDGGKGLARDTRVDWALEEVGPECPSREVFAEGLIGTLSFGAANLHNPTAIADKAPVRYALAGNVGYVPLSGQLGSTIVDPLCAISGQTCPASHSL